MNYKILTQIQECAKTYLPQVAPTLQSTTKTTSQNKKKSLQSEAHTTKKQSKKNQTITEKVKESVIETSKIETETWQQAIILSEILGPPVSRRKKGYLGRSGRI